MHYIKTSAIYFKLAMAMGKPQLSDIINHMRHSFLAQLFFCLKNSIKRHLKGNDLPMLHTLSEIIYILVSMYLFKSPATFMPYYVKEVVYKIIRILGIWDKLSLQKFSDFYKIKKLRIHNLTLIIIFVKSYFTYRCPWEKYLGWQGIKWWSLQHCYNCERCPINYKVILSQLLFENLMKKISFRFPWSIICVFTILST